jgi:hypothetical protein
MGLGDHRWHEAPEHLMLQAIIDVHAELSSHDTVLHVHPLSIFHDGADATVRRLSVAQGRQLETGIQINETLFGESHAQCRFQHKVV